VANLYHILKISPNATQLEIKLAYRRLVKQFHPDSQCSTADHEKIVQINAAYEILGDPEHRLKYDRQHPTQRQQRQESAQKEYQDSRTRARYEEIDVIQWQQVVYLPIERTIRSILSNLSTQNLEYLATDPFDDLLMLEFQNYLDRSQNSLEKAKVLFRSRPNPAKLAKVAAGLYYCLNQISDGLEEFQRFTYSYDDSALHQGQEFFRLARHFLKDTKLHLQHTKY
jgi:molecular chaperone DnaJ